MEILQTTELKPAQVTDRLVNENTVVLNSDLYDKIFLCLQIDFFYFIVKNKKSNFLLASIS